MKIQEQQRLVQEKWLLVKEKYKMGDKITGIIMEHYSFGITVDIDELPVLGFIRIPNIIDKCEIGDYERHMPKIGEKILGVVVEITEHNKQINISLRASHLEKYP